MVSPDSSLVRNGGGGGGTVDSKGIKENALTRLSNLISVSRGDGYHVPLEKNTHHFWPGIHNLNGTMRSHWINPK